jgi:hypothetical protein
MATQPSRSQSTEDPDRPTDGSGGRRSTVEENTVIYVIGGLILHFVIIAPVFTTYYVIPVCRRQHKLNLLSFFKSRLKTNVVCLRTSGLSYQRGVQAVQCESEVSMAKFK